VSNHDATKVTPFDFVDLKIKPTYSFRCVHRVRICVYVFIDGVVHTYISIYIYIVFLILKNSIYF
jgi:hypothetical protein